MDRNESQINTTLCKENSTEVTAYVIIELFIAIFALFNNGLVLAAVYKYKHLHTTTYKLVASLAVADIAVALLAIPSAIVLRYGLMISSDDYTDPSIPAVTSGSCSLIVSLVLIFTQVSIFNLLIIAIDRFIAIYYSLRYKAIVTTKRVRIAIAGTWILGFLVGFVPFVSWTTMISESREKSANETQRCVFEDIISMDFMVYFNFFGCVLLPLTIMFILYFFIFKSAKEQLKKIYSDVLFMKKQNSKSSLSSLKSIKDVFAVYEKVQTKQKISLRTRYFFKQVGRRKQTTCHCNNMYDLREADVHEESGSFRYDVKLDKKNTESDFGKESVSGSRISLSASEKGSLPYASTFPSIMIVPTVSGNVHPQLNGREESLEVKNVDDVQAVDLELCSASAFSTLSSGVSPANANNISENENSNSLNVKRKLSCDSCLSIAVENDKRRQKLNRRSKYLKKEFRAARSLFTVLGAFAFCWLPLHIHNVFVYFAPHLCQPSWFTDFAILLSHANSLINPVIYAFQLREMKTAFKNLFNENRLVFTIFSITCVDKTPNNLTKK